MLRVLYRAILRLYPAEVRRAHGAEMESIFLHCLRAEEARWPCVLWPLIWMRGLADAVGFALAARRPVRRAGWRGTLAHDARWVVRGMRARGWSAVLAVTLMAVAMGASTLVFSSADALVFNPVPYPDPHRLVTLQGMPGPLPGMIRRQPFEDLQQQVEIFSGVDAHQPAVTFLTTGSEWARVDTVFVTPHLLETLGVLPRWGRSFTDADRLSIDPTAAIVDVSLARELFGAPSAAVGQTLETADRTLTIVGVMPPGFRYPDGRVRIWRALDVERLRASLPVVTMIARLQPSVSVAEANAVLSARLPALAGGDGRVELIPRFAAASQQRATTLRILLGAALCLLLAACANVASLEMAGGLRRIRTYSVQMALGASRASLVRIAGLEVACLVGVALALAWGLAATGAPFLTSVLPETITLGGVKPIDADWRGFRFLLFLAAGIWVLASLPTLVYALRPNVVQVLTRSQGVTLSRGGSRVRRGITIIEVALAVTLLVGGVLYLRSYAALLTVETGIDTRGVVRLGVTVPPNSAWRWQLSNHLLVEIGALPYVRSVSSAEGGPPGDGESTRADVELDTGSSPEGTVIVTAYDVTPSFFSTVGLLAVRGRVLEDADPPSNVVVTEAFARYLWGDANPIGRAFRLMNGSPWSTVVGVVPHVRTDRDYVGGSNDAAFLFFRPQQSRLPAALAPASRAAPPEPIVNAPGGALYGSLGFLVRLSDPSRMSDLLAAARSVDSRGVYSVEPLDASYARRHAETRAATTIISIFAGVAFLIAIVGVFGVMTVLVSSRTREIGIRMAVGADPPRVRRMVLGASLRLVTAGIVIGTIAALGLSRFIESQLFGVTPNDPSTFAFVAGLLLAFALLATWHPARRAARVDPAVTLRAE